MGFCFSQKILFKHCDPAGIVFYPRYFEMINDCVEAFFAERLDMPFEILHQSGAVPTVEILTNFQSPSRHGDLLEIMLDISKIGRSSLGLLLVATSGAEIRFTTKSTLVYTNKTGKSERWPMGLRRQLENFQKGNTP